MSPDEAVRFAVIGKLNEPVVPAGDLSVGYFVYTDTLTEDAIGVVAFDARNEVPHHFRLRIEKVDD